MIIHTHRKGIILAAGNGRRLSPITSAISKQLMLIYDKPMIYYPLSTLMLCGVKDILIITTSFSKKLFQKLLGNGSQWGINLSYKVQEENLGISHAISLSKEFVVNENVVIALGDNIFHGSNLVSLLGSANISSIGGTIFAYPVSNPQNYGVVNLNKSGEITGLQEKPRNPSSKYAITGLYFFDNSIFERINKLEPSPRQELEITSLNTSFWKDGLLNVEIMGRGTAWFDTGTFESLQEASAYIRSIQKRQGLKVGCPEEIAWRQGWINNYQLEKLADPLKSSGYGEYLFELSKKNG